MIGIRYEVCKNGNLIFFPEVSSPLLQLIVENMVAYLWHGQGLKFLCYVDIRQVFF